MRFVFFIVAAVVAIVVGVVVLRLNEAPPPPPPVVQPEPVKEVAVKTVNVLVAKVDIPVGTVVDSSMVDSQPWPEHLVLSNFISAAPVEGAEGSPDPASPILGKVVRSAMQAREPFIRSKLADPNDAGFISATLPPGMRAISLPIDNISGISGYIFPGDHVDILFIHQSKGASIGGITEVLSPNVKILAIGSRQTPSPDGAPQDSSSASAGSITVEVSDEMAQKILLAQRNGSLTLSLRSIKDDNTSYPAPTTISDISKVVDSGAGLVVVRGPKSGGVITVTQGTSASGAIPDSGAR